MKLIIIPLVSKIHPANFYQSLINEVKKDVSPEFFHHEVTTINDLRVNLREYDVVCLIFVTGGTSKLGLKLVENYDGNLIMLSHAMHNSLPSALSFRNRLTIKGRRILHLHASNIESLKYYVDTLTNAINVINDLRKIRIGVIGRSKDEEYEKYTEIFGGTFIFISLNDIKQYFKDLEVIVNLTEILGEYNIRVEKKDLSRAAKVYLVIKRLIDEYKLDVIAVDCFNFINLFKLTPCLAFSIINSNGKIGVCEADYSMIPLMYISQKFTGKTGWIANIFDYNRNWIKAAHCTIPRNMVEKIIIDSHFETGLPAAIRGELKIGEYTLVTLSKDFKNMFIRKVKVSLPLHSKYACRSQHLIILRESPHDKLINNHHLISTCDATVFIIFSHLLGLSMT